MRTFEPSGTLVVIVFLVLGSGLLVMTIGLQRRKPTITRWVLGYRRALCRVPVVGRIYRDTVPRSGISPVFDSAGVLRQ